MRISISNTDFYLLLSVFACLIQPPLPHTDVRIANRNLGFNTFVSLPPDVFNDLVNLQILWVNRTPLCRACYSTDIPLIGLVRASGGTLLGHGRFVSVCVRSFSLSRSE